MRRVLLILLFVCLSLSLSASESRKASLDSLVTIVEQNDKMMGSLSVFCGGEEIYQRSFGYADLEQGVKASAETLYRIGSITKSYTAVIIMKLIEEGKLSLKTTLDNYFPEIENAEQITIAQMLGHKSGIANFTSAPDYFQWNTKEQLPKELTERIIKGGSNFAPGERFEYSNSNYALLAFIAEKITGKSDKELLREVITEPLGLENCYVGEALAPKKNEALSYKKLKEWGKQTESHLSWAVGAGDICATSTDVNRFFAALFGGKLISSESLNKMLPKEEMYGLGLMKALYTKDEGYGHNGGIDGFLASAYYFPESELGITLLLNGANYSPSDFLRVAYAIVTGGEYQLPQLVEPTEIEQEQLELYVGEYEMSEPIELELRLFVGGGKLCGQAKGQPSFTLDYYGDNQFRNEVVGVVLEFDLENNLLQLKQSGRTFELNKIVEPQDEQNSEVEEAVGGGLELYSGHYKMTEPMVMEMRVFVKEGTLYGQATGQGAFPLEATGEHKFRNSMAGIVMEFDLEAEQFVLKQSGFEMTFDRVDDVEVEVETAIKLSDEQLSLYTGNYKMTTPMVVEMRVFVKEGVLYGQATGQGAFPLEASGEHKFRNSMAGIVMEFDLEAEQFVLKQGGYEMIFERVE